MTAPHGYQQVLETSRRVSWRLEDLVGDDRRLDLSRPLLPETFARTRELDFLGARERLLLNQIRARGYLGLFELVESFIVPFLASIETEGTAGDAFRRPALHNFALEEEKHRRLFTAVLGQFDAAFPVRCGLIGPAGAIRDQILNHGTMGIVIAILALEWMSQGHYLESVRDDQDLDAHFKSLLRHHWLEECQHARLDALLLQALADQATPRAIDAAVDDFLDIGAFLDGGLKQQASFDLQSLEAAAGRGFSDSERARFLEVQYQAQRWTFLGSAMRNPNFLRVVSSVCGAAATRIRLASVPFAFH